MKALYRINQIILLITIILYVTIYLGMLLQILLGGIQIISALILFRYWKQIPQKIKEHLNIYWVITIVYGICWLFNWDSFNETFIIVFGVMVLPMSIAIYFFYILHSIKKTNES